MGEKFVWTEVPPSSLEGAPQLEAAVQADDQEMGLELVLQAEWVGKCCGNRTVVATGAGAKWKPSSPT